MKKAFFCALILFALSISCAVRATGTDPGLDLSGYPQALIADSLENSIRATVTKAIDGSTFSVSADNENFTIGMIGVDSLGEVEKGPTALFGADAKRFAEMAISKGAPGRIGSDG